MAQKKTNTKTRTKGEESRRVYIATDSGAAQLDPEDVASTVTFVKGKTRVAEGNALLDAVPDSFELVEDNLHYEDR